MGQMVAVVREESGSERGTGGEGSRALECQVPVFPSFAVVGGSAQVGVPVEAVEVGSVAWTGASPSIGPNATLPAFGRGAVVADSIVTSLKSMGAAVGVGAQDVTGDRSSATRSARHSPSGARPPWVEGTGPSAFLQIHTATVRPTVDMAAVARAGGAEAPRAGHGKSAAR